MIYEKKQKRLEEAKRNFQKIWKRIEPFIKKKKIKSYSTAGKWKTFDYVYKISIQNL
jgi:L-rhamnose mutarotase